MKIKLSLILILVLSFLIPQLSNAQDDPCADEWADFQYALAAAGGNFKDPYVQITIRALRVCRLANG
ncbi:MAG: hypothetical protein JKY19_15445 [Alcanivoracaceae bacterium]|nr:hypothetical protein [Alcanivoracaceae bacterium]